MCIAAIIHAPISLAYLQAMEDENPHGAGVAWVEPGDSQVTWAKGLTAADIFAMQEAGELTFPYMLHFRWATAGVQTRGMTHPFPLGPRALFGELRGRAPRVLIHNGTWHNERAWIPDVHPIPEALIRRASDTAIAAWIAGFAPQVLEEVNWATAVGFVGADGVLDVELRGTTWDDHDGNWYSNMHWMPRPGRMNRTQMQEAIAYWNETGWNFDGPSGPHHYPASPTNKTPTNEPDIELEMELNMSPLEDLESDAAMQEHKAWEDYIRAKYGHEVAEEMRLDYGPADDQEDIISEDPGAVNSWLAARMLG